jgi:phosphatidylserine/phosphatidylglycerophosphate/cardiolipin synthase-like enzyme
MRRASGRATPTLQSGATASLDGISAYFQSARAGLDAQLTTRLVEFIEATQESLDCAIYDLRHPAVLDALARLAGRHKRVRIAFDASQERSGGLSGDPKPGGTLQAITAAGLLPYATPVHERGRHLMHAKFLVRDERAVWVGSANFTQGGLELQDNNCLTIDSRELAAAFGATFAELLGPARHHRLARTSASGTSGTSVTVGGATLRPLFAPAAGEGIEHEIIAALKGARRVRVMAFLLSDPGILGALAPLGADPRFDIRGVYDRHGMQDVMRYSRQDRTHYWFLDDPRFVAAPSHAFAAGREQDFMHNKVLVVDDHRVFTGSYNFSENAEANDEVALVIDSTTLAAAYTSYCDTLYAAYSGEHVGRRPAAAMTASDAAAGEVAPGVGAAHDARKAGEVRAVEKAGTARRASARGRSHAATVYQGVLVVAIVVVLVLMAVLLLFAVGLIHP